MKGNIKMKENSEAKSKRSPGLLTVGGVEILAIPPSIKRMAGGRKIHIWTRPFKCGLGMATDKLFSENPEEVAFNQRLMKKELEVINRAVGSLNMSHIKTFLIQKCNVPDPTNLTWRQILAHLEVYLHSQKAEQETETEQKDKGSRIMITARTSKENWEAIESEYDISKRDFGKKINFVSDSFKRNIIFRDVEHAFVLASQGFSKPALILAGGVIEELLRLYLEHKKIRPKGKRFFDYVKACEDNGLLKRRVSLLTDSIRDFRNLVHLDNEETKRHTVSKATAKGAVSSIFTIANDFPHPRSN